MKSSLKFVFIFLVAGILIGSYFVFFYNPWEFTEDRPIKIFILNSYRYEYPFTKGQNDGFLDGLVESGIDFELKDFSMSTKANKSEHWKQEKAMEAMELINEWKPDLLYITDDNAQKYVGMNYLDTDLLIIFSGINANVEDYGYDKARNVAGVLERYSFSQPLNFFHQVFPFAEKIAVIRGDDVSARSSMELMKKGLKEYTELEIVEFHLVEFFEDYKKLIMDYQGKIDGVYLGDLSAFKYESGESVDFRDLVRWTVENSKIPEISGIEDAVGAGVLLGVSDAPYDHGVIAWEIAEEILLDGRRPSSFPSEWEIEGDKFINLARAKMLGLDRDEISSVALVGSGFIEGFSWDVKNEE